MGGKFCYLASGFVETRSEPMIVSEPLSAGLVQSESHIQKSDQLQQPVETPADADKDARSGNQSEERDVVSSGSLSNITDVDSKYKVVTISFSHSTTPEEGELSTHCIRIYGQIVSEIEHARSLGTIGHPSFIKH